MSKRKIALAPGKDLAREMNGLATRYPLTQIFRDFVEISALAIANVVDREQFVAREQRYLSVIGKYPKPDRVKFPVMLGCLIMELDRTGEDVFAPLMMQLDLHGNKGLGQFFTPWSISYAMARMTFGTKDAIEEMMGDKGYITMLEPACGAGGMVLASARACEDEGINPQQCLHFIAVDIDPMCTQMTYIQAALMGIPAVVCLGDSLRSPDQMKEHWFTPMHILGQWDRRLAGQKPIEQPRLVGDQAMLDAIEAMQRLISDAGAAPAHTAV